MIEIRRDTIDFNSEIIFGEIGGLLASPVFGYLAAHIKPDPHFIAFFAVVGSIIGCAVFWLATRVKNHKRRGIFSKKKIAKDIMWYSPVATATAFLIYQPVLFVMSAHLLERGHSVLVSILVAQFLAFLSFAIVINLYRTILEMVTGRRL